LLSQPKSETGIISAVQIESVAATPADSVFMLLNETFISCVLWEPGKELVTADLGKIIVWELGILHLSSYVSCS
jgi:hypothetical protein